MTLLLKPGPQFLSVLSMKKITSVPRVVKRGCSKCGEDSFHDCFTLGPGLNSPSEKQEVSHLETVRSWVRQSWSSRVDVLSPETTSGLALNGQVQLQPVKELRE